MKKIMLSKEHLTDLMRGKIITLESIDESGHSDIQIALSDIGFYEMENALRTAIRDN